MKNTISEAKNLGFIAKMNKANRIPAHDQKFMETFKDSLTVTNLKAWLQGWDEAHSEYVKTSKNI
jgi:hypothetical protein